MVIPTFNRARLLKRAIQSALDQSYKHIEIIVADDGSTDDTRDAVAAFGNQVQYLAQRNAGVAAARNLGLAHANGEFVALLDSDDAWLPWKLEAEVGALRRVPSANLVWTDMIAIDDDEQHLYERFLRRMYSAYSQINVEGVLPRIAVVDDLVHGLDASIASQPVRFGDLSQWIALGNLVHTSSLVFRRQLVAQVGGFDPTFRSGEDYDFHLRACSAGPVVLIDAPSILYRVGSADQLTVTKEGLLELARHNLDVVQTVVAPNAKRLKLPRSLVRQRIGQALRWIGTAELEMGNKREARRYLLRSLARLPGIDRRIVLLALCILPDLAIDVARRTKGMLRAHDVERVERLR